MHFASHWFVAVVVLMFGAASARAAEAPTTSSATPMKFAFGSGRTVYDYRQVLPINTYSKEAGFGLEPGASVTAAPLAASKDALSGDYLTSDKPFLFSVTAPEGNYRVTVTFAGPTEGGSVVTVKAESRRLMLLNLHVPAGKTETRTFTVNVHTPALPGGGHVKLKEREKDALHWDDKLTLEFSGQHPAVCAVEIARADDVTTVFLAGDSTVTDQTKEPWYAWGQALQAFFADKVAIANYAESGESLKSFAGAKRWDKVIGSMKKGDWLLIQFGHNDEKDKAADAGAFKSYKKLLEKFVADARQRGGKPVLLTPMHRRTFGADGKITNSHGEFPDAVRAVAKEQNVPLIDLLDMSQKMYEAWGPEQSVKAFVHYPAHTFPGQDQPLKDNTHFNAYGGYEIARCVVQGMKDDKLELAEHLRDVPPFDPSHPDPIDQVNIPPSPLTATATPEGR